MNVTFFFYGLTIGICIMQATHSYVTRRQDKPFLLAFCFLSAYYAASMTVEAIPALYFDTLIPQSIMSGIDYGAFPLLILEAMCLTDQSSDRKNWKKRWTKVLEASIPIHLYIIYCLISGEDEPESLISLLFVIIYPLLIFCDIAYHLRKYQRLFNKVEKKERQDIKWAWIIIVLLFLQYAFYVGFPYTNSPTIYHTLVCILIITHGYFIQRQAPLDTSKIEERLLQEQAKTLEELKDVTESLKKKATMETTILEYKTSHPGFENRLRALTENKLTQRDIYLCIMICEGKQTNEMAEELAISPSSVEIARHRLRTKLNLEKGANLKAFLLGISEMGGGGKRRDLRI